MTHTPLRDRLTGLITWLADRIAGLRDPAGPDPAVGDQAGAHWPGLEPRLADALLARLRHLAARFRAVAAAPIPPPKPARPPAEPRFVATYTTIDRSGDSPPAPNRLPRSWGWLARLLPHLAAERAQLEATLRDPAMTERLAADPRLGRILRPLGWMLGVERAVLPPSRWRRRQVILVPGERAEAVAEYAAARATGKTAAEVIALCCVWVPHRFDCGWDRQRESASGRPRHGWLVWRGCEGPGLPGLAQFSA